jgi:polar amino acid transport system substrate-binding protein
MARRWAQRPSWGLALLLLCWTPGWAEEIRLVTGEFAPYSGKNLPNGGMMTELVSGIFYQLGHPVSVTYLPWKRGYQATRDGRFSATFPYSFHPERANEMLYSAPLHSSPVYLFVHVEAPLNEAAPENLQGLRLCTALGYNVFPPIEEARDRQLIELITVREMDNCVRMLENRRADAIFLSEDAGWNLIERVAGSRRNYRMLAEPIHTVREYLLVSKRYPGGAELIEAFNEELARLIENGRYQQLIDKHLLDDAP